MLARSLSRLARSSSSPVLLLPAWVDVASVGPSGNGSDSRRAPAAAAVWGRLGVTKGGRLLKASELRACRSPAATPATVALPAPGTPAEVVRVGRLVLLPVLSMSLSISPRLPVWPDTVSADCCCRLVRSPLERFDLLLDQNLPIVPIRLGRLASCPAAASMSTEF
jgi:hypothetical protein